MGEGASSKYLGVLVGKGQKAFNQHCVNMVSKLNKCAGLMLSILRGIMNPCTILPKLWNIYMLPRVLYGAEVVPIKPHVVDDLEVAQKGFIKNVFRWMRSTSDVACYLIGGVRRVQDTIIKCKMGYYQYVAAQDDVRWSKQAFYEQWAWGVLEGIIDDTGVILVDKVPTAQPFWFKEVVQFYRILGHHKLVTQTKTDVRMLLDLRHQRFIEKERKDHTSIKYMDNPWDMVDHDFRRGYHMWWQKARVGSLFLGYRNPVRPSCPLCNAEVETLDHFLDGCQEYSFRAPDSFRLDVDATWALSVERSFEERALIDRLIRARWKERKEKLDRR